MDDLFHGTSMKICYRLIDMITAGIPFFFFTVSLWRIKSWTLANDQFSVETNVKPSLASMLIYCRVPYTLGENNINAENNNENPQFPWENEVHMGFSTSVLVYIQKGTSYGI